jgi:hypothetical protein
MKLVAEMTGAGMTMTRNEHETARCSASVAEQVTVADPTGNAVPLAGVHVVVTGACPPLTTGAPYDTVTAVPSGDGTVGEAGHVMVGPAGGGGVGVVVDSLQPTGVRVRTNAQVSRAAREKYFTPGIPSSDEQMRMKLYRNCRAGLGGWRPRGDGGLPINNSQFTIHNVQVTRQWLTLCGHPRDL